MGDSIRGHIMANMLITCFMFMAMAIYGTYSEDSDQDRKERASKTRILTYDTTHSREASDIVQEVTEMCNCRVEQLKDLGALILHHNDSNQMFYDAQYLDIEGIDSALTDNVMNREQLEKASKTMVLTYEETHRNASDIVQEVKEMCNCRVEHLKTVGVLILHHNHSNLMKDEEEFKSIAGIVTALKDDVVECELE